LMLTVPQEDDGRMRVGASAKAEWSAKWEWTR
jgi:hypothetical protein